MLPATGRFLLLCAIGALSFSTASAADPRSVPDPQKRYQEDRAFCLSGKSSQDRATCLREAGAALQDARRGRLEDAQAAYEQNKFARCAYHRNPADREYCERRMRGEGTTSGSVEGGGILRELIVAVPPSEESSVGKSN